MDIFDILQKVMITFFVGSLLFAPIYAYIRHRISKKKSESGVDKRKIQYILQELVHTGEFYTVAYAYWYQMDYPGIGRSYTTSYWYYAIGFNENRIYIVPLMLEDGEIYYSSYSIVEKSMVKKVESESQYGKMKLFDQEGRLLAHLQVEDKNYSSFGSGDVDLYQKEEARSFRELVEKWTAEINDKGNSYNINQRCYTVKLTVIGNDEIAVIKAYRDITGIGIKEARDKIVTTPCVLIETTNWEEAELYKKKLEELGATIEISES